MGFVRRRRERAQTKCTFVCLVELLEARRLLSVNVLTWHNDQARTGLNSDETLLTPGNVNQSSFGKLFSYPVDGQVYAQPLYVSKLAIPGKGTHDVVFVATEHDSVYAFDADSDGADGGLLWHVSLGSPATTPSPYIGYNNYGTISPFIGITGTPVIDPSTDTMYVDAFTNDATGVYTHQIHALDITTGADKMMPALVAATFPGNGPGGDGTTLSFTATRQMQRPALTLLNGTLYVAYGSYGDTDPYHGWVLSFDPATLQLQSVFNTTPNNLTPQSAHPGEGAIWQAGAGLASDASNLYAMVGNGDFDASLGDYGDSFIKLSTANGLAIGDYFTPQNQQALADADEDLGSAGPMVLPDSVGSADHPHLLVGCGKQGLIYLIDRDNMGQYSTADEVVQEVSLGPGAWSNPAYFNGRVYFHASGDVLKAFSISDGALSTTPVARGSVSYNYPGATPSISSDGNAAGIVWEVRSGGVLHAYDATTLAELYNSSQAGTRDRLGSYVKFTLPTIADGKVFVATANSVAVFGLYQNVITAGGSDTITLKKDGNVIAWALTSDSGAPQAGRVSIDDANGLTINGGAATETLVLDDSNGSPLPDLLKLNGSFSTSDVPQLSAQQTIDLGTGSLLIHYTGASPLSQIEQALASGFDGGKWDGTGLTSSAARANPAFAIGDTDSADPLNASQPAGSVLLKYALSGNATLSGKVGLADLVALARHYNQGTAAAPADWSMGDFNYSGTVDFPDLMALARNYGANTAPAIPPTARTELAAMTVQNSAFVEVEPHGKKLSLHRRH